MSDEPRPVYQLTLECLPSEVSPEVRLKGLLKHALRVRRLRCLRVELVESEPKPKPEEPPCSGNESTAP